MAQVHSDCPMFNETQYEATGCAPQLCFPVENPGRGVHRSGPACHLFAEVPVLHVMCSLLKEVPRCHRSYDNILYGWVTLFINMSCLYWWETAHRYYDLHNGLVRSTNAHTHTPRIVCRDLWLEWSTAHRSLSQSTRSMPSAFQQTHGRAMVTS